MLKVGQVVAIPGGEGVVEKVEGVYVWVNGIPYDGRVLEMSVECQEMEPIWEIDLDYLLKE